MFKILGKFNYKKNLCIPFLLIKDIKKMFAAVDTVQYKGWPHI